MAEALGYTVTKLLTGKDQPLTNLEYVYWLEYFKQKAKYEEEAGKPKKKEGQATQNFKKTMGNTQST